MIGIAVGVGVGVFTLFVLGSLLLYHLLKNRRSRKLREDPTPPPPVGALQEMPISGRAQFSELDSGNKGSSAHEMPVPPSGTAGISELGP